MREISEVCRTPDATSLDLVRAWSISIAIERDDSDENAIEWLIFTGPDGEAFHFDPHIGSWDCGDTPYPEVAAALAAALATAQHAARVEIDRLQAKLADEANKTSTVAAEPNRVRHMGEHFEQRLGIPRKRPGSTRKARRKARKP